jgi:hypothetical protein
MAKQILVAITGGHDGGLFTCGAVFTGDNPPTCTPWPSASL